jgi:Protein of unknown function (DUF2794)
VQLRQNWGILPACKIKAAAALLQRDDRLFRWWAMSGTNQVGETAVLLRFAGILPREIRFERAELGMILGLYGRNVASGEWRDYAIDFGRELACFSVFRRSSEQPLYRIIKNPILTRKNGLYSVVTQGGLIMKRGNDLAQVLKVLEKRPKLADA